MPLWMGGTLPASTTSSTPIGVNYNKSSDTAAPATFYTDVDYGGAAYSPGFGSFATVGQYGDKFRSLQISPFVTVTIYRDSNFGGSNITLTGPQQIRDIYDYDRTYNRSISSLSVKDTGPSRDTIVGCCSGDSSAGCYSYVPGSAACSGAMVKACSAANMNDPACQSWCRSNPGKCDAAMLTYCKNNPSDPICACINSKALDLIGNPACIDRACTLSGYMTSNMLKVPCPDVISCTIQANLANSGVSALNTTKFEQNCGQKSNAASTSVPSNGTAAVKIDSGSANNGQPDAANAATAALTLAVLPAWLFTSQTLMLLVFVAVLWAIYKLFFAESKHEYRFPRDDRPRRPVRY